MKLHCKNKTKILWTIQNEYTVHVYEKNKYDFLLVYFTTHLSTNILFYCT